MPTVIRSLDLAEPESMTTERSGTQPPKRVTVLLDPELAERFERYCRQRGFKKSTLAARLIREHLEQEENGR